MVQREVQDPAEYAETWARDGGHHSGTADFDRMYAAWLDDFASREVESIGFGVITLHKPLGATGETQREPVLDLVEVRHPVELPMGPTVLAGLRARVWLAEHDDDEILDHAWVAAGDVHEERHTLPGALDPSRILWHQGGDCDGACRSRRSPRHTPPSAMVSLTARAAAAAIAGLLGADDEAVRAEVVAFIRDVARDGFLNLPITTP